jgi:hypothetical protein
MSEGTQRPVRAESSRRAILSGVIGGAAVLVARGLTRTPAAQAANGDVVHAGQTTTATAATKVTNTATSSAGLWGEGAGPTRHGVFGSNTGGGLG